MSISEQYAPMIKNARPPRPAQTVDREAFRQRLIFVRERLEQSKTDFAASIGISKSNYTQVEKGVRLLTVDQIYAIYRIYGVPMEYLLAGQESNLPDLFR